MVAGPVEVDPVQLGEFVFFLVDLPEVDNVRCEDVVTLFYDVFVEKLDLDLGLGCWLLHWDLWG